MRVTRGAIRDPRGTAVDGVCRPTTRAAPRENRPTEGKSVMTIENWVPGTAGVDGAGDYLELSVPAECAASRVLCCAVQGAVAALSDSRVGESARQAVSAACALVLGDDGVGG